VYDREGVIGLFRGFQYSVLIEAVTALFSTIADWSEARYGNENGKMHLGIYLGTVVADMGLQSILQNGLIHVKLQAGESERSSMREAVEYVYERKGVYGWYETSLTNFSVGFLIGIVGALFPVGL